MNVLGRDDERTDDRSRTTERSPATVRFGSFLARDGSDGAAVGIDVDSPHAAVIFGKRGTGKSYTLGVIAEGLADAVGVSPVVVDPMGVFGGLTEAGGRVLEPAVRPSAIPAAVWPDLLGLDPAGGPGSLLWRVVADAFAESGSDGSDSDGSDSDGNDSDGSDGTVDRSDDAGPGDRESPSIESLRWAVSEADAPGHTRRAVRNHLRLAESWGVFDAAAAPVTSLVAGGGPTVIDLSGTPEAAAGAVLRAVARGLYDARVDGRVDRLPWLLVDEAHAFFGGVADPALRTLLTRGRAPGVSLVCATQRPSALPSVAVSQSDLLVAHRLTAGPDVDALATAEATYLAGDLAARLPTGTGEALVVDDASETAHTVRVRRRRTPHGGGNPRASDTEAARADRTTRSDRTA